MNMHALIKQATTANKQNETKRNSKTGKRKGERRKERKRTKGEKEDKYIYTYF